MSNINNLVLFTEFSNSEPPIIILPTLPHYSSGIVDIKHIMNNSRGYKLEIPVDLTNKGTDISNWECKNELKAEINNNYVPSDLAESGSGALKTLHDAIKLHHMKNR